MCTKQNMIARALVKHCNRISALGRERSVTEEKKKNKGKYSV